MGTYTTYGKETLLRFTIFLGIITGTDVRSDLILIDKNNSIFIIELPVGHESTTKSSVGRKAAKYKHLIKDKEITGTYNKVNFVNLVMTSIGVYSAHVEIFFSMLKSLGIDRSATKYITSKLSEICIRSSYFIFCMRVKDWSEPELMKF